MEWEQITGIGGSLAAVMGIGRLVWYVESEVIKSLREQRDELGGRLQTAQDRIVELEEGLRAARAEADQWRRQHHRLEDLRRGRPWPEDMGGGHA